MRNKEIVYAEVYEILSYMDKITVMQIPIEILTLFKEKRDKNYISRIDKQDIFNKNNIQKETLDTLAYLDLHYWANPEEKKMLLKIYTENEQKLHRYNDIFENKVESQVPKHNEMIVYCEKKNFFEKIKNFLMKYIHK